MQYNKNRNRRFHESLSQSLHSTASALLILTTLLLVTPSSNSYGQDTNDWIRQRLGVEPAAGRDNGDVIRLVRPLTSAVKDSVVQILCGGRPVSLGTVVGADGYILTKRSELSGDPIRVRFADNRSLSARVAVVRRKNDLALLKVSAPEDLKPISFVGQPPEVASFVITPGRRGQPIGVGVVGVTARSVPDNGRLGVLLDDARADQALVRGVFPKSGAQIAGIKPGDQIVAVNDVAQSSRKAVVDALHAMFPGENVRLTIIRKGDTLNLDASIHELEVLQESENDTKVNGRRSARLSGFDSVIQHDTVLDPDECGGPMLNSNGQAIGLNIARAGRVVSYALPGSLVIGEMLEMLQQARNSEQ